MANQWFRLYSEFAIDAKIQSMDETLQRRYIMLLCLRCNGDVTRSVTDENEIACYMRISVDELKKTKEVFIKKKFIDDRWNVLNWNKRQFISDSSTERVARHREKKKNDGKISNKNVTKCNVTVTPPESESESYTDIKEKINKKEKFTSPTIDEVKSYITEKNYTVNPEAFVNFYTSKNWMIGKNKMKCWKSAINTWQQNEKKSWNEHERRQANINSLDF